MRDPEDEREQRVKRVKSPWETLIPGAIFTVAIGAFWYFNQSTWWLVFPLVFFGILPLVNGLRRLLAVPFKKKEGKMSAQALAALRERQILQVAHDQKGRLTAAGAALRTELSIQEAAQVLDRMAKDGHAVMTVTSSGTVEYEFTDFLPDPDRHQLL